VSSISLTSLPHSYVTSALSCDLRTLMSLASLLCDYMRTCVSLVGQVCPSSCGSSPVMWVKFVPSSLILGNITSRSWGPRRRRRRTREEEAKAEQEEEDEDDEEEKEETILRRASCCAATPGASLAASVSRRKISCHHAAFVKQRAPALTL